MSVTKNSLKENIGSAINSILGTEVGDTDALSASQQAAALQSVQDYLVSYTDTVNPDVKQKPTIKFLV